MLLPCCCAAAVDQFNRASDQRGSQLTRIGDGRRAADKLRIRTVEPAKTLQAAQYIGEV